MSFGAEPAALPAVSTLALSAESGSVRIDLVKPGAPGPSMRRTPLGGPPVAVAVAFADADEPLASWLRRLLLRIRSVFQPKER